MNPFKILTRKTGKRKVEKSGQGEKLKISAGKQLLD